MGHGQTADRSRLVAAAIAVARHRYGTMRAFAQTMGEELGVGQLSRQAIYGWEMGTSRVPAQALLIAAEMVEETVDHLLSAAAEFVHGPDAPARLGAYIQPLSSKQRRLGRAIKPTNAAQAKRSATAVAKINRPPQ